jgi:hypothetical protein
MTYDPSTPAGQLFADRALAHETIKSQLEYERVARVAKADGKPVPSRLAVAVATTVAKGTDPTIAADAAGQRSTAAVLRELYMQRESIGLPSSGQPRGVAKAAKATAPPTGAPPKAKQSSKARPSVVAVYDSAHNLIGVVDPDDLTAIPQGSATYNAQGACTGFVGADGKLVQLADGIDAVQKAVNVMVAQATTVAKQLQGHRVAKGLAPTRRAKSGADALAVLTSLGNRVIAERVAKSGERSGLNPLIAAAVAYHNATPAGKLAVRKALAKTTPESRKRARVAIYNAQATAGVTFDRPRSI